MEYDIVLENVSRKQWEQYAGDFSDYSIYQTWPYQKLRAESSGQKISRMLIKNKKGHAIMMGQVRIKSIELLSFKIGYVQWGPLVRSTDGNLKWIISSSLNFISSKPFLNL